MGWPNHPKQDAASGEQRVGWI